MVTAAQKTPPEQPKRWTYRVGSSEHVCVLFDAHYSLRTPVGEAYGEAVAISMCDALNEAERKFTQRGAKEATR